MGLKIAAPPFQAQLFFKTANGAGFSESYWVNKDTYQSALDAIQGAGKLVAARAALMTPDQAIDYVRVSDTTKKRDTLILDLSSTHFPGTYNPTEGDSAADEVALLVRWQGVDGTTPYFCMREMRLIPEEIVEDSKYKPVAAWTTKFDAFVTVLKSADHVMVIKTATTTKSVPITDVIKVRISRRKVGRPFGLSAGRTLRP